MSKKRSFAAHLRRSVISEQTNEDEGGRVSIAPFWRGTMDEFQARKDNGYGIGKQEIYEPTVPHVHKIRFLSTITQQV